MILKNIAKKVVSVLPVGSGMMYELDRSNKSIKERERGIKYICKSLLHASYTVVAGVYLIAGGVFDCWTPNQYKQVFEKLKTETTQRKEYKQKLFGVNGYADKDGDGKINSSERFEVYEKAGLEDRISFRELSLEDLERAVKSYEADNKK